MAYISLQDLFRFISPDEVKVYCGYSANLREESILPAIQSAQNLKLYKILGSTLYNKLKEEFLLASGNPNNIRDSSQSPDGIDYKGLYFQCFLPLVWWTAFYALENVAIKIDEKGLMMNSADYSENGGLDAYKFKEDRIRQKAEEYVEQLICYLEETFPKNSDSDNLMNYQSEGQDEGSRFSGIHFPKKNRRCCNKSNCHNSNCHNSDCNCSK